VTRNDSIVGFTLAEFGFSIVFVLIALALPGAGSFSQGPSGSEDISRLRVQLDQEQKRSRDLAERLAQYAGRQPDNISRIPPSCSDKPLLRLNVLGADLFEASGRIMKADQIHLTYKNAIEQARDVPCVYLVHAILSPGISAENFVKATKQLEKYFYVRSMVIRK
jgi:hypothetical protein